MTHCNEHLLGQMIGQKAMLYSTLLPVLTEQMTKYWRGRNDGEVKRTLLLRLSLFVYFVLFCFEILFWKGAAEVGENMGELGGVWNWGA